MHRGNCKDSSKHLFHLFHLPHNILVALFKEQAFVMPVIQVISVLINKPDAVGAGIQFCDKSHHLLSLSECIFQKPECVVKSLRCVFRHPVKLFSLPAEHIPHLIERPVAHEHLAPDFQRKTAQRSDHPAQRMLLSLCKDLSMTLFFQILLCHGSYIVQHHNRLIIPVIDQILVELIKLANLIITITKAINSGYRISDVFRLKSSIGYGSSLRDDSSDVAISFENVSFSYSEGAKDALSDISFTLKKGEVLGVIGGTGSGKSTLSALIARLYDARAGEIRLFGKDIREYGEDALSDTVSVVLQKARLFKGTIRSNLQFVKKDASEEEMMRALEIARAKEFVDKKGLDATVEALGRNLSGGQRQRLSIARAVLKGSAIMVLDDSSSALDYKTESELRAELSKLDSTLVIISQRASSMLHADKIIVLDDGKISAIGTHDELLKSSSIYSEIYYTQFEKEVRSV